MMSIHPYWLIVASSIFALIPVGLALVSSYMKVSIVLGMLRSGLGTPQIPSGSVIMALSFALTAFIMAPVAQESVEVIKLQKLPSLKESPSSQSLKNLALILEPWKKFMDLQAGVSEKRFFRDMRISFLSKAKRPVTDVNEENLSQTLQIVLPAFVFSELKEAFAMAFVVLLPFLIIDLVVANVLVGLGMYMVSPVMISLPLKLFLFVGSDAWMFLARGLIESYQVT